MSSADFSAVPGNEELKTALSDAVRSGTLGHAYIIEGKEGIGKHVLAESLAKAVLCVGDGALPCGKCPSCIRAAANTHPDIRTIGREGKASLGVDVIRRMRADTHVIPSESDRKVYIIEDADTMTVEAQNAFLLSLEEPPAYVLYLLLCCDSKSLLETIRSRAPQLRMRPCTRSETEDYVLSHGGSKARALKTGDPDKWSELIVSANGSPVTALDFLNGRALSDRIAEKERALSLITSMLSSSDDAIVEIATMKKPKRDGASKLLDDMISAMRDMLLVKKTRSFDTCFFTSFTAAEKSGADFAARKLALAIDAARECADAIERNGSITTSLLSMAIKIKNS